MNCMQQLWLVQARRVGCNTSLLERQEPTLGGPDWRFSCVEALRLRNLLDCGKAWNQEGLVNLVRPPGRFSALKTSSCPALLSRPKKRIKEFGVEL